MNSLLRIMATGSFIAERMRTEGGTGIEGIVAEFCSGDSVLHDLTRKHMVWSAAWCLNGFPRVHLGHKHAASLMATNTKPGAIPDARAPWEDFLIDVPDGLVSMPSQEVDRNGDPTGVVRNIDVHHVAVIAVDRRNVAGVLLFPMAQSGDLLTCIEAPNVGALGDFEPGGHPSLVLLCRLALGVCMEMTSTTYKGGSLRPRAPKRDPRTGEPQAWTFQLTRDVKVDCRDAVRAYSQGKTHASPTVQTLVRGHWKQQTCGKGGSERKNIFVEPYWRGPEDAHIALRKHDVKGPPDEAKEAN